jgi:hypothetical protein
VGLFRRHQLLTIEVALTSPPPGKYEIWSIVHADNDEAAATRTRFQQWLGTSHVSGQSLATIVTTARSA